MKNCPGVSPIAAHLNYTIIPTQTPVSSGGNGMLTNPVLATLSFMNLGIAYHLYMNYVLFLPVSVKDITKLMNISWAA